MVGWFKGHLIAEFAVAKLDSSAFLFYIYCKELQEASIFFLQWHARTVFGLPLKTAKYNASKLCLRGEMLLEMGLLGIFP